MRARILLLFIVSLGTPFVTAAVGQTAGAITGTLADANGGVLPGVAVAVATTVNLNMTLRLPDLTASQPTIGPLYENPTDTQE